jgi:hypothetical protein
MHGRTGTVSEHVTRSAGPAVIQLNYVGRRAGLVGAVNPLRRDVGIVVLVLALRTGAARTMEFSGRSYQPAPLGQPIE